MTNSKKDFIYHHFKKKLVNSQFWLTHVLIYFIILFTAKYDNSPYWLLLAIVITYPLFILTGEYINALRKFKKEHR